MIFPADHIMIFQRLTKHNPMLIFVGDMKIQKDYKKVDFEGNIITIRDVAQKDAGSYECIYQTKPNVKVTYEIDVQYPPTVFSKTKKTQKVLKGKSVTVACQAKGNPQPVSRERYETFLLMFFTMDSFFVENHLV